MTDEEITTDLSGECDHGGDHLFGRTDRIDHPGSCIKREIRIEYIVDSKNDTGRYFSPVYIGTPDGNSSRVDQECRARVVPDTYFDGAGIVLRDVLPDACL